MTSYLELLDEVSRASIRCVEKAWQEEPPPKRDGTKMVFIPELLFDSLNSAVQRLIVTDRYNDSKSNSGKGDKQIGIYSFPKGGDYKGIDIDTIEGIDKDSTHLLKRAGYNTTGDLYNISVSCIHRIPWMGERASFAVVHKIAQAVLIKMGIDTYYNSKVIFTSDKIQDEISEKVKVTAQMIVDRVIKNESEVNITPEEFEKNKRLRLK